MLLLVAKALPVISFYGLTTGASDHSRAKCQDER